jgi:hypothetical protein
MGTYTRSHSFTAGEKPTEAQWNVDIDGLITLCNGQIDKANVDSSSTDGIVTMDEAQTVTGRKAFSGNIAAELTIDSTANAAGSIQDVLTLEWDPGDGNNLTDNSSGISLLYKMPDDADNQDDFAALTCMVVSDATGSEEGEFSFRLVKAGTLTEIATLAPTTGLTIGSDGGGYDVVFHSATGSDNLTWDASEEVLQITGTNGQTSLDVLDGDVRVVDKLYFYDRGGEYLSSDGSTLTITGAVSTSSTLNTSGAATLASLVCTAGATFGGGTGSSGATISTTGTGTFDGILKTEDTTEATSTTDGSLQTDGGLSVAKDVIVGDDLKLLSDSAVLSLGDGSDATLTHDGTTGVTIAANPIIVDSGGNLTLDAHTGILILKDAGSEVLRLTEGNSGDVTVKLATDGKDLVFTDNGDATNMKILDAAAGINVPGEVQTTGIGYTDGDNAITIADGGGCTFPQTITASGDISVGDDILVADGGVINFNSGDVSVTHSSNLLTVTGGGLTVGVDDTGHDVTFFGASAGAKLIYDESEDTLEVRGPSADATTSTGKLKLTTALTNINDGDVLGRIDFAAPLEAGGTDAILAGASLWAEADATFSASVNQTSLVFATGASEAATERMRIDSGGKVFINASSNGDMTTGLTIDQGTADDEVIAFKSSEVDHDIDDYAEDNTFGSIRKSIAGNGGMSLQGFTEATSRAVQIQAISTGEDTTQASHGEGTVDIMCGIKSGSGAGGLTESGDDIGNLLAIRNWGQARFIFRSDGTGYSDVAWTTYDTYDDLAVISEMESMLLENEDEAQTDRRHYMEQTGIIGEGSWHMADGKPRAMINWTKLSMLHHGALIQVGDRLDEIQEVFDLQREEIASLKKELKRLKG